MVRLLKLYNDKSGIFVRCPINDSWSNFKKCKSCIHYTGMYKRPSGNRWKELKRVECKFNKGPIKTTLNISKKELIKKLAQ